MLINTKTEKVFLSLFTIALIIWLGGTIVRTVIAYDNYIPFTRLELKPEYTDEIRNHNIYIFANTSIYTIISFGVMIVSGIVLFAYNIKILKLRGWLFMAFILFFLSIPFEIYSIILDISLLRNLFGGKEHFNEIVSMDFMKNKFQYLGIVQPMVFLAYISGIIILIFKPLDINKSKNS